MRQPDPKQMTEPQRYAYAQLKKAINGSPIFKVGVIMLTYPPTDPNYVCRTVHGIVIKDPTNLEQVRHLVTLVEAMKDLTSKLEAILENPELIGSNFNDLNMA